MEEKINKRKIESIFKIINPKGYASLTILSELYIIKSEQDKVIEKYRCSFIKSIIELLERSAASSRTNRVLHASFKSNDQSYDSLLEFLLDKSLKIGIDNNSDFYINFEKVTLNIDVLNENQLPEFSECYEICKLLKERWGDICVLTCNDEFLEEKKLITFIFDPSGLIDY